VKAFKNNDSTVLRASFTNRQIFSCDQEKELKAYAFQCSAMFYGLTTVEMRSLAYQTAKTNNIAMPDKWVENKIARKFWLYGFMKRNPDMVLREPEP